MPDGISDGIKILAPCMGTCRICAAPHDALQPHDKSSLYYQMRFWQKHKRFATWADAMLHCDAQVQTEWIKRLRECGEKLHDGVDEMTNDWVATKQRPPEEADADVQGCVLVWHKYNGVMLMNWHLVRDNPYVPFWMPPPAKPEALDPK